MNYKHDTELMNALKVETITYLIAKTNKGELSLNLRFREHDYFLTLDSVQLDKEKNEEVMAILIPKVEKKEDSKHEEPKVKGRPKGSKNK